jgi:hypothetical protein
MNDNKRKAIRERVLALLDSADAGGSDNWRDSDPAYWIGVVEGEFNAEPALSEALDEAREVLRDALQFAEWVEEDERTGHVLRVSTASQATKLRVRLARLLAPPPETSGDVYRDDGQGWALGTEE